MTHPNKLFYMLFIVFTIFNFVVNEKKMLLFVIVVLVKVN